jgi:ABC-2 type transport system ATP-binding protein
LPLVNAPLLRHLGSVTDSIIHVRDLCKSFDGFAAVEDVSFAVPRGSTTALLGANGAGKTTTLAMLLGVLLPTSGTVSVLGHDMTRDRHKAMPAVNFSSPYVDLPRRLTVGQTLRFFAKLFGVPNARKRVQEMAEVLDLTRQMRQRMGSLSAGQKTRVSLAKALINAPEVLILDEPTASLDPDTGDWMRGYLEAYQRESGCAILLASHNMGEVERLCDDVLMMRQGRIVDRGAPRTLIGRYGRVNLEEVFLDIARERSRSDAGATEVAAQ